MHYWWSLVLLGIGWNWLFLGSTALLPETYKSQDRFKAQGINDFLIFGIQAISSLSAGWILNVGGWTGILTLALPIVVIHGLSTIGMTVLAKKKAYNS